jgi:hypothetical protein
MSKEQRVRTAGPAAALTEGEAGGDTKEALERRMEEARESIAQTVTEIKDTVVDKFESVKESVEGALDWREQFRSHPVAWALGALAVGYVLGNSVSAAVRGAGEDDHLISHLNALAGRFTEELSEQGMKILTPVLSGAVLVPILIDKVGELSGIDLSGLGPQLAAALEGGGKASAEGKGKKGGAKKKGKKDKKDKRGASA